MKYLMPAIRFKIFVTVLFGLIYPFAMTGLSQILFSTKASGNFVSRGGQVVGSLLLGQKFEKPEYFWPRPSAVDFNPLSSGGSNLGQTSEDLQKSFEERKAKLKAAHVDQQMDPPQDLLFASGSGLDPHISLEAAKYQETRVAKARNLSIEKIDLLIAESTAGRQWGILGEPTVNVLALNMALDRGQGIETAPVLLPVPTQTATPSENTSAPTPSETK